MCSRPLRHVLHVVCDVCDDNYHKSVDGACATCEGSAATIVIPMATITGLMLIALCACLYSTKEQAVASSKELMADGEDVGSALQGRLQKRIETSLRKRGVTSEHSRKAGRIGGIQEGLRVRLGSIQ